MSKVTLTGLATYLLFSVLSSGWYVYSLSQAPLIEALDSSQEVGPSQEVAAADDTPRIDGLQPNRVVFGQGVPTIMVSGVNFEPNSEARISGTSRATEYVDSTRLFVVLRPSDLLVQGRLPITVHNPSDADDGAGTARASNAVPLHVGARQEIAYNWDPPDWWAFSTEPRRLSGDARLLLLVLFVGSFGAGAFALQSFADYRGARKLSASWTIYYVVKPWVGAGMALVFYLVIRGGLFVGTDVQVGASTPYGLLAISALVGMFSDKAVMKLRELFVSLVSAEDERPEPLVGGLTIGTEELNDATVGQPYSFQLEPRGSADQPYRWTELTGLPNGLDLTRDGMLQGSPDPGTDGEHELTFVVRYGPEKADKQLTLAIHP